MCKTAFPAEVVTSEADTEADVEADCLTLRCASRPDRNTPSNLAHTSSPLMFRLWILSPSTSFRYFSSDVAEFATPATNAAPKWTPNSTRTDLNARKRGMTSMYDDNGVRVPVTVLQVCFAFFVCVFAHVRACFRRSWRIAKSKQTSNRSDLIRQYRGTEEVSSWSIV